MSTRKVHFTFSREQDESEMFQPAVHEAMREYMAKAEDSDKAWKGASNTEQALKAKAEAPGMDYLASNGVRIQIEGIDQ